MGVGHNELTRGRLSKAAKAAFEVDQGEGGLERFSETLQPVADLWSRPEWALLRGENLYARSIVAVPAVAARFSIIQLLNPLNSHTLITTENVWFLVSGGGFLNAVIDSVSLSFPANPVVSRGNHRDTRYPLIGETSIGSIISGDAGAGAVLSQLRLIPNSTARQPISFVLRPGSTLFFVASAVNLAIDAFCLEWRERNVQPAEEKGL